MLCCLIVVFSCVFVAACALLRGVREKVTPSCKTAPATWFAQTHHDHVESKSAKSHAIYVPTTVWEQSRRPGAGGSHPFARNID